MKNPTKLLPFTLACILTLLSASWAQAQNTETATGTGALVRDPNSSDDNTADGYQTLTVNSTGNDNTAVGFQALQANTEGLLNTAVGSGALFSNITGTVNSALGFQALYYNTDGQNNTALGAFALYNNNGSSNTAIGLGTLEFNTSGAKTRRPACTRWRTLTTATIPPTVLPPWNFSPRAPTIRPSVTSPCKVWSMAKMFL